MKQADVIIGEVYEARVSRRMVDVKVLARISVGYYDRRCRAKQRFLVKNLFTGREIRMTAARIREKHLPLFSPAPGGPGPEVTR